MQSPHHIPLQPLPLPVQIFPNPNAVPSPPPMDPRHATDLNAIPEIEQQNIAWRYHGYPALSQWMSSSNDFFILRRYSKSAARSLLFLQHEIGKREKALDQWDTFSKKQQDCPGGCGTFDEDSIPARTRLIQELCPLLQQYYDLVNAFSQVKSRPSAQDHHRRNLKNWFTTYPTAIRPEEQHYLDEDKEYKELIEGDLFPIIARPKSPLRSLLHRWRRLRFFFHVRNKFGHVDSPLTRYHSDAAFDNMVCFVTVLLGLGLLFGPMWYMHYIEDVEAMLGIITGFVTLFAFWLWVAAGPRQFEILLGSAAYAAVVYIYLQAASSASKRSQGGGSGNGTDTTIRAFYPSTIS